LPPYITPHDPRARLVRRFSLGSPPPPHHYFPVSPNAEPAAGKLARMVERSKRPSPGAATSMSASSGSPIGRTLLSSVATPLTVAFWTTVVCFHHFSDAAAAAAAASSNGTTAGGTEGGSSGGLGSGISWALIKEAFQGTVVRAVEGGPENLQPLDLLFCGVLIIMALELLSFLTKRSGGEREEALR